MKFAIISAGEGSRLSQEGVTLPKPLVQLNGVAMIDRLIRIFIRNGADKVVVIINNESPLTKEHLAKLQQETEVPLEVVVKTTPSSMHSFYELSSYLQDDKFCLTTVDTIFLIIKYVSITILPATTVRKVGTILTFSDGWVILCRLRLTSFAVIQSLLHLCVWTWYC